MLFSSGPLGKRIVDDLKVIRRNSVPHWVLWVWFFFFLSFFYCKVEVAQLTSGQNGPGRGGDKLLMMLCCEAATWWYNWGLMKSQGRMKSEVIVIECTFCTSAKLKISFVLEKHRVWAVSIKIMEFAQIKEQDGQRKKEDINIWNLVDVGGGGLVSGKGGMSEIKHK